jgi:hypothetical protein
MQMLLINNGEEVNTLAQIEQVLLEVSSSNLQVLCHAMRAIQVNFLHPVSEYKSLEAFVNARQKPLRLAFKGSSAAFYALGSQVFTDLSDFDFNSMVYGFFHFTSIHFLFFIIVLYVSFKPRAVSEGGTEPACHPLPTPKPADAKVWKSNSSAYIGSKLFFSICLLFPAVRREYVLIIFGGFIVIPILQGILVLSKYGVPYFPRKAALARMV